MGIEFDINFSGVLDGKEYTERQFTIVCADMDDLMSTANYLRWRLLEIIEGDLEMEKDANGLKYSDHE